MSWFMMFLKVIGMVITILMAAAVIIFFLLLVMQGLILLKYLIDEYL